jgi:hypothetical protein
MIALRRHQQPMQDQVIVVVFRQDRTAILDRSCQVDRIF